ncbi:MAG: hypothetical protein HFI63_08795 [Lachnospiraceae bacterium]|nr:hypothetical protein [Lachnospiraceae bacterium]
MGEIHDLPDGTKLVVWEERNQILALTLPLRRGAGVTVLARDVLKDLTCAVFRGSVYYACHSLEHRIFFGLAGDGQPTAILSDPSDERRYSALRLLAWKEELYLFFRARSRGGKTWELKVMRPLSAREAKTLWEGFTEPMEPVYVDTGGKLVILSGSRICTWDGKQPPEQGEILRLGTGQKARDAILKLEAENRQYKTQTENLMRKHETQLGEIKKQYDELAVYATELQQEGKRWREKYYKKH